jgi:hypothetical protein
VDIDHGSIVKIFEEEVNNLLKRKKKGNYQKRGQICWEIRSPIFLM